MGWMNNLTEKDVTEVLPLAFRDEPEALSPSGLRVGGRFWTNFHQPGSPNSCAPERKNVGLPTDKQPATVLHHVDVFFLPQKEQHTVVQHEEHNR